MRYRYYKYLRVQSRSQKQTNFELFTAFISVLNLLISFATVGFLLWQNLTLKDQISQENIRASTNLTVNSLVEWVKGQETIPFGIVSFVKTLSPDQVSKLSKGNEFIVSKKNVDSAVAILRREFPDAEEILLDSVKKGSFKIRRKYFLFIKSKISDFLNMLEATILPTQQFIDGKPSANIELMTKEFRYLGRPCNKSVIDNCNKFILDTYLAVSGFKNDYPSISSFFKYDSSR